MPNYSKRLAELASRGGSAAQIAATLAAEGIQTSRATVGRELRKLRGTQRVGRRASAPLVPSPVPVENVVNDEDDPKNHDGLLRMASRALLVAEQKGDLAALARFGNLMTSILEAKRKAAPPAVLPAGTFVSNDEMKELADEGEKRLLALIDEMFRDPP